MAKHIHIPVSTIIGEYEDDYGFTMPGFTEQHIDWYTGYDVNGNWAFNQEIEQVTLHINSPGGDVHEGFAIYNKLLRLKEQGVTVEVHVEGICASIATVIALAASPGKLKMREASEWMTHKAMVPEVHMANSDELRALADALDSYNRTFWALYSRKTGKSVDEIKELLKKDVYMNAEEAKAYGFVDEVITGSLPEAIQTEKEGQVKAVAFYNPKRNPIPTNKMAITKEEKDGIVSAVIDGVKALFGKSDKPTPAPKAVNKPTPKPKAQEPAAPVAATTETADGATIYFEGEAIEQGTAVFADAELTEALEDGEYELADGRTIEVVDGAVANITEAEEEEEEEGAAASADDNAPVASAKRPQPKAKAKSAEVVALENRIKALEKLVPGSGNNGGKAPQNFVENEKGKAHPLDRDAAKAKIK